MTVTDLMELLWPVPVDDLDARLCLIDADHGLLLEVRGLERRPDGSYVLMLGRTVK